jgi:hypothetical protein
MTSQILLQNVWQCMAFFVKKCMAMYVQCMAFLKCMAMYGKTDSFTKCMAMYGILKMYGNVWHFSLKSVWQCTYNV